MTLDPHATNEGPTQTLIQQVMEPLVVRDMEGAIAPALATEWGTSPNDPRIWILKLREGVRFLDGAEFDSDDVVFSLNRARSENSGLGELLVSVEDIRSAGKHKVEIETAGPNLALVNSLPFISIMDRGWAEQNAAEDVQDLAGGEVTFAAANANGTGPYKLVSREVDVATVLDMNEDYWGKDEFPLQATEIVFTPIQQDMTRVAALLSGDVDFIQDVPVQDVTRLQMMQGFDVRTAPQNRVIFLGLNSGDPDLLSDSVLNRNPLADVRVRRAISKALDRDAIRETVMHGQSRPAGMISPPFVSGWDAELDRPPERDIEGALTLMEAAGYPDGFSIVLNCPNDRYINDEEICQAAVGMLARIGIEVFLDAKPRAQHFPLIFGEETDFNLLGWGVPTYDPEFIFKNLVHTRTSNYGAWNGTRHSDPKLDAMIRELAAQADPEARNAQIAEIWQILDGKDLYVPIHHQVLNWGMRSGVQTVVSPDNFPLFKYFVID